LNEYLTVAEIAELLKLNPQTIRNMIDRGELPAVRVGSRRVRVLRSDLDEFLAERRRVTKKTPVRLAFDAAVGMSTKTLRSKDHPEAAEALRALSIAALNLAKEIEQG
jgi:excisionase family DNA binding protein